MTGKQSVVRAMAKAAQHKREDDARMVVRLTDALDAYREALQAAVPALANIVKEFDPDTTEHQLCADALLKVRDALRQPAR